MAKILIIDDDKVFRERLKKTLDLDGHEAFVAEDGPKSLEISRAQKPEIALLDITMPGMSGLAVLEKIREEAPGTEVIMLTGCLGGETAIQALRKGAFDYLTKPLEYDELEIGIRKVLAKQETERKLGEYVLNLKIVNQQLQAAQAQLVQSAKMAVLGQLAAGVAHEINNPLTAISMNAAFLLDAIRDDEKKLRQVSTIAREADRAAAIVASLLAFSRKSRGARRASVRINQAVEDALKAVEHQFALANIETVRELDGDLPDLEADANQLQQVFMNMLTNARDAMPEGGRMTIRTCLGMSVPKGGAAAVKAVRIEFSDTGKGIAAGDVPKIFDPFFTTKDPGKGTGLGLSISRSIIADHGGDISVENRAGKGATFTIRLPVEKI